MMGGSSTYLNQSVVCEHLVGMIQHDGVALDVSAKCSSSCGVGEAPWHLTLHV